MVHYGISSIDGVSFLVSLKSEVVSEAKKADKLKENIGSLFEGCKAELEDEIDKFDSKSRERHRKITRLSDKIGDCRGKLSKFNDEVRSQWQRIGSLEAHAANYLEKKQKRDEKITNLATKLGLKGFDVGLDDAGVRHYMETFRSKVEEEKLNLERKKENFEVRECRIQEMIDNARVNKASEERNALLNEKQAEKNDTEIKIIRNQLTKNEDSQERLFGLEQDKCSLQRELDNKQSELDENALEVEIESTKNERNIAVEKVRQLQEEMKAAQSNSEKRAQLDFLIQNRKEKREELNKLLNRHSSVLKDLFGDGDIPTKSLKSKLEEKRCNTDEKKNALQKKFQNLEIDLSKQEHMRSVAVNNRKLKEQERRDHEEKMFQATGGDSLETRIAELDKELEKLRHEKGSVDGGKYIYGEYMRQLESSPSPCCPLCHRNFDRPQDSRNLSKELESKIANLPKDEERLSKKILETEEVRSGLLEMRPVSKQMDVIVEEDLPTLNKEIDSCAAKINDLRKEKNEYGKQIETLEKTQEKIRPIENDIGVVDKCAEEIRDLDTKICVKSAVNIDGRRVEEVQNDMDRIQATLDDLNDRLEKKQSEVSDYRHVVENLRYRLNNVEKEQLDIRGRMQEQQQLKQKIKDLEKSSGEYVEIAKCSRNKIEPLEKRLKELTDDIRKVSQEKRELISDGLPSLNDMESDLKQLNDCNMEIRTYISGGEEAELPKAQHRLEELKHQISTLEQEETELQMRKRQIEDDEKHQEVRKRELEDNLELMETEQKLKTLKRRIVEKREEMGDFDPRSSEQKRRQLAEKVTEKHKKLSYQEGQAEKQKQELEQLNKDLDDEMFKYAGRKHRNTLIDKITTEQAYSDLNKYYKAMDSAIMTYHANKMEEINKNLLRLWHSVYRSSDIDSVRIVSENNLSSGGAESRRVYNYRVVMDKGGIDMDMRGRCSAGQKVLASILIRIALAEVFCLQCGVLTLDEPTTNLDSENRDYLAQALITLLSNRQEQQNFQLVLISHDEKFLKDLWSLCRPDYFYSVSKDANGYSRLKRHQDFDEIRH